MIENLYVTTYLHISIAGANCENDDPSCAAWGEDKTSCVLSYVFDGVVANDIAT